MNEVVIVEAGRSPVGRRNGSLAGAHPTDVLGQVLNGVLGRAGINAADVGQIIGGCINKVGAQAMNVTRTAWLAHGGAEEVPCITVDSQCGSSQEATNLAYSLIASGVEDIVLACGVENMSLLPIGSDAVAGAKAGYGKPVTRSYFEHYEFTSQFEGAERIAEKYGISRMDTDALGLESQLRAARAIAEGRFAAQLIPVEAPVLDADGKRTDKTRTVTADEIPRKTSLEALAGLKPVARADGVHTAGSSSQIADGANCRDGACRLRPGADARRADPSHAPAAQARWALDPRHRRRGNQRGLCLGRAGLGQGDRARHGACQSQRRRHCAGSSTRRDRVFSHHQSRPRAQAVAGPLRADHDVLRGRPRDGHLDRARLRKARDRLAGDGRRHSVRNQPNVHLAMAECRQSY